MLTFVKVAISSRLLWFFLLITYFICSLTNYILMKYFYTLMIIDTKYLFFWSPESYYLCLRGCDQGPMPLTSFIYIILLLFVLYKMNKYKDISQNVKWRGFLFLFFLVMIHYPESSRKPGPMTRLISSFPYSPIQSFMKETKMDYLAETVYTPFGKFKMHKRYYDSPSDLLYVMQEKCRRSVEKKLNDDCVRYPYK